jgi:hypothetical protein
VHRSRTKFAARVNRLATGLERRGIVATYELHDRLLANRSSRRRFGSGPPQLDDVQRDVLERLRAEGYATLPPLRTEEPFSPGELAGLARAAGGELLEPVYGSFVGSVVNLGLHQALFKLGRPGLRARQPRLPLLDRLAHELLLPVVRP